MNKTILSLTIISCVLGLTINTAYADPIVVVTAPYPDEKVLQIVVVDGMTPNQLFQIIEVMEEACPKDKDGNILDDAPSNCTEFVSIHYTKTIYNTNESTTTTLKVPVEYGKKYTVKATTIAGTYTNYDQHFSESLSIAENKGIGEDPATLDIPNQPYVSDLLLSTLAYPSNVNTSGVIDGNGDNITNSEYVVKNQRGKIVDKNRLGSNLHPALFFYPSNPNSKDVYTITLRTFNGVWSDPYTMLIDWKPKKQDVIKDVKAKIEYAKENNKTHSQKVWQRVLLALDDTIPDDSPYHFDPRGDWGGFTKGDKLTPFDLSGNKAKKNGDKFVAKANSIVTISEENKDKKAPDEIKVADNETYYYLKDVNPEKYNKLLKLGALWYNIHAHK